VFLLLFAVPALLVVVVGYLVGFGLWTWIGGAVDAAAGTSLADGAEVAGWITGALLLVVLVRVGVVRWRRSRRRRGGADWS
jgi:membrane associated rhomboid family serine protease